MRRALIGGVLLVLLTGCAAQHSRVGIYPARGQSLEQQGIDTQECREAAKEMAGSKGQEAAVGGAIGLGAGALAGAGLGAIVGAFFGQAGSGAAFGAALGGATGGLSGAATGAQTNDQIYQANTRACLNARGYAVGN